MFDAKLKNWKIYTDMSLKRLELAIGKAIFDQESLLAHQRLASRYFRTSRVQISTHNTHLKSHPNNALQDFIYGRLNQYPTIIEPKQFMLEVVHSRTKRTANNKEHQTRIGAHTLSILHFFYDLQGHRIAMLMQTSLSPRPSRFVLNMQFLYGSSHS